MQTIIEPTTDAKTERLYIPDDRFVSIAHDGLISSEEITVNVILNGVSTPVVPKIALSAAENVIQLAGPNKYDILKQATTNPVGFYVVQ